MVLFTADWCRRCLLMFPTLNNLDLEYKDQFKFYTVNIDKELDITTRYEVSAVPTTIVFKGGHLMTTYMGANPLRLKALVEQYK
ncbi:Thioredoxin domain [Arabidopsis thaliana x Arabidopsis arenosa]|uniref:Thioredoxin domain n=1 Tax=Arabidopsis thaliana x Arabidopsis arenosa TaxID=1240361 RepID=A0A8T2CBB6_9BRAS|nr:Thioredoxin domain [Arabidopsis thaliana x Arabidopsis arenosa]